MADESGKIEIGVVVDPSQAVKGLNDLQDELGFTAEEIQALGKTTEKTLKKQGDEYEAEGKRAQRALEQERESLRRNADQAEDTGQRKKKALDSRDTIDGLDSLKESTGELDSSLKGLGGAAGLLSPELERVLFVTGELSGGVEAGTRLTSLFGGSMGSLLRVAGPVAVAVGGLAFTYKKLSGGLKEAEERLDKAHEAMQEGIAQAKAYQSRMRSVRVSVGLLSREEANLRAAREEAADSLEHQNDVVQKARERLSILTIAINHNQQAMSGARTATGSTTFATVEYADAMDEVKRAAEGEAEGLEMTARSAGSLRANMSDLANETLQMQHAADMARQTIEKYNTRLDENQAIILIGQAITSADIDQMIAATEHLDLLTDANRGRVEATLLGAIATEQQARALDEEAEAAQRSANANSEAGDEIAEASEKRATLARMLAEAQGQGAIIELEYAQAVQEARDAVEELGATEEEVAILIEAAKAKRKKAVEELAESEATVVVDRQDEIRALVALEKSMTQEIVEEHNARQTELFVLNRLGAISDEEFAAKSIELTREKNRKIKQMDAARAMEGLASLQAATGQVTALMDAVIGAQLEKLKNEEESALAAAAGNMEEQEKIRAKFREKRKRELGAEFATRKGLEIANAVISGASATIAALAPPPIGPGPLLGPFMAGAIAATTAAQIAIISQQQPKFHQGGIVGGDGDRNITAQGGEVVLNRDAVADLGGPDAANRLNQGATAGGTVVVQMTYRQRMFDQLVVDNLAKGGPLKKALNRATKRGRRGRVGGRL